MLVGIVPAVNCVHSAAVHTAKLGVAFVKSECKNDVPGMVHDVSATGSTYFVEPLSAVNANNALRELELKEKKEIERILAELSAEAAGYAENIRLDVQMLIQLDVIFAKAKLAYRMRAWAPIMNDQGRVELRNARHPLIDPKKAVPISLRLGSDFDTMIITGPNTGGKTVTLKTIGLLTLMAECGLHVPAGDGSTLSTFDAILADIGDEQSIEQSLSTFSSHMVNIVHILCSLWFAFGMDMGIVGIAYASVIAQWTGVALSALLLAAKYRPILTGIDWSEVLDLKPLKTFFIINRDIILRTFCIVAVYTFFTGASARMDDPALLAVNTLLLQLFTLFSYMNDGFAYAAEALTGRFIGARDEQSLRRCLGRCLGWGTLISVLFVGIYLIWWRDLLGIFIKAGTPDAAQVVSTAGNYIVWIILIPIASAMPFIMDGIMVGATETKVMRNSMLLSTVAYFGIFYSLYPVIGNNALWLAFTLYMFLRGALQLLMTRRLRLIYRKAAA